MCFVFSFKSALSGLSGILVIHIDANPHQPEILPEDNYFMKEFILWGLVEYNKLSKDRIDKGYQIKDIYGSFIDKL